jgi:hypothetical protein
MARSVLNLVIVMRWSSPWGPLPVLVRNGHIRAIDTSQSNRHIATRCFRISFDFANT